jgi:hypothetical protein
MKKVLIGLSLFMILLWDSLALLTIQKTTTESKNTTVVEVLDLMSDDENIIIKDSNLCIIYNGSVGNTKEDLFNKDVDCLGTSDDTEMTTCIIIK